MFIEFRTRNFKPESVDRIALIDRIICEYTAQGYRLTLRQLYYQLVARGYIANEQREYKRLGDLLGNARLAGLISWNAIEDRTRNLEQNSHWRSPESALNSIAKQYGIDMWQNQPTRVEVWIEKQALAGVIDVACTQLDVPYYACRGYASLSEMFEASRRFDRFFDRLGQDITILYLGDHDPSGMDMTRDIDDRLRMFTKGWGVKVKRIALNMPQIEALQPPSDPAKVSDSRHRKYVRKYGHESWELDALEPRFINNLIIHEINEIRDYDLWKEMADRFEKERDQLDEIAERFEEVIDFLEI